MILPLSSASLFLPSIFPSIKFWFHYTLKYLSLNFINNTSSMQFDFTFNLPYYFVFFLKSKIFSIIVSSTAVQRNSNVLSRSVICVPRNIKYVHTSSVSFISMFLNRSNFRMHGLHVGWKSQHWGPHVLKLPRLRITALSICIGLSYCNFFFFD